MIVGALPIPAQIGLATLVLWSLSERLIHAFGLYQPHSDNREKASLWWLQCSFFGALLYGLADASLLHWTIVPRTWALLPYAGVVMVGVGTVLRVVSRLTLGRQFSGSVQTTRQHQLVTWGIYRWLRHPAYLAFLCLILGFPVCFGSLGGLAIAVLSGIPALIYRVRIEEAALNRWFGEQYVQYRRQTSGLIPRIW
jgi:protein-S-isoprenylcysteine O-methyltransferase